MAPAEARELDPFTILPVNDVIKHSKSYLCPCLPHLMIVPTDTPVPTAVWVHNAWDGRE